ncbi:hypothetical protein [Butyrivibrio sp. AC2005]|uniref:hypothetical protein n=1 Tax=Butyrivibrio sp. AC2005 TaxID=1280672 RepID=UPI0003FA222D|nr:hypothetical protein [Butyrivibrio sp. AC2005]
MPFEKKKKYKTAKDYKQKTIYLNESDPYQNECYKVLELCGHKQAKFLGLLVHDYVQKIGINVECIDDKGFKKIIGLLEEQVKGGITAPLPQMGMMMQPVMMQQVPYQAMDKITSMPQLLRAEEEPQDEEDEEPFKAEDLGDMKDALKAFGVC